MPSLFSYVSDFSRHPAASVVTQDKCLHSPTESPAGILRLEPPSNFKKREPETF